MRVAKILFLTSIFVCIHSIALADSQNSKFFGQAGIGGVYYDFGGENISSAGAYVGGEFGWEFFNRVHTIFGVRLGGGQSKASQVLGVAESSGFVISDQYVKVGVNIAGVNAPLYVNLLTERNNHDSKSGLSRHLSLLGAEIEGALPLGNVAKLEYSAGYAFSTGDSSYSIAEKTSYIERDFSKSYVLSASVGFVRNLSDSTAFYTKLIGKYQNLNAAYYSDSTQGYPSSSNLVGMLEFGFRGL